jgi:DNA topoisomerase-1
MRTDGVQMAPEAISAARKAIADRFDAATCRTSRASTDQGQERAGSARGDPPDRLRRDRAGSGDHARLYELVWKRALASQMASARLERTTVELATAPARRAARDRPGRALPRLPRALRGRPRRRRRRGRARRLPRLAKGDAPAKKRVDAEQHFTQPPPRYSEASLVKKMEELGIGRPSTYARSCRR